MKVPRIILLPVFLCVLLITGAVSAGSEPRPSESVSNALFFGDINAPLPPDLTPPPDWEAGMVRNFFVLNIPDGQIVNCSARLMLVTENIVFWCDERASDAFPGTLYDALFDFDAEILPMLRKTFGHEVSPGADNDQRFHVVFTDLIGQGYNGYFSSSDSADPRLSPSSNGMELVFLHTALFGQGADAVADTLSHEIQHMIHFAGDPNETSFINEGLSGLAQNLAVRSGRNAFIRQYLNDTSRSLIWWPESGSSGPWYGSSFLFSRYLYDRFGEGFIRDLVRQPGNGLNGVDQALRENNIGYNADEVFIRWAAALLGQLLEAPVREWDYASYPFPQDGIYRDVRVLECGDSSLHEIPQYGLLFYKPACGGPFRLSFTGAAESPITPLTIPGGRNAWWSGAVSNSLAYLRREFDLSGVSGPVYFEYDIDFNIETGYDYYYLLLRDEDGRTHRLAPSSVSADNPAGENLGGGTTGSSGGVRHESVDLSPWAGRRIVITFVYLTDTAGISDGLIADNFRIGAIGFSDGAEASDNGWETEGFSRVPQSVPQRFSLAVLRPEEDGTSSAGFYNFSGGEEAVFDCPEGDCVFAVSAVSREVRSRTSFTIRAEPAVMP